MTRWSRGEADVERMLASGELQRVKGEATDGRRWLEKATTTLASAEDLKGSDPNSAYTLAYDAARFACAGLLAQQGLRATTSGGHYAVQQTVIRQFGPLFEPYGTMRRRRNELEYPEFPDEVVETAEAGHAIAAARSLIDAAEKLLDHLGLF
ncbi:HEPN domain-containing protein [Streptosporangium sp. NBC_01639]|uniref:HEPN domain-containing protein n=1 Tax=Streptosporangium sp. NBC_01639 TaxID=2975948 RepID=UPI00386D7741|nr:HEPN domain-containing protein [Streptosporangium sp. NBC_01639]